MEGFGFDWYVYSVHLHIQSSKENNATDSKSGSLPLKSCRTYPLCNSACWPISHSRVSQMAGKKQQYLYINDKE
jgi:hypothetical protein